MDKRLARLIAAVDRARKIAERNHDKHAAIFTRQQRQFEINQTSWARLRAADKALLEYQNTRQVVA